MKYVKRNNRFAKIFLTKNIILSLSDTLNSNGITLIYTEVVKNTSQSTDI